MPDLFKSAVAAHQKGRIDEAVVLYKRTILENPLKAHAYYLLGCIYMERQVFDQAHDCFSNATRLNPENASYLHAMAQLYSREGKIGEGLACLQKASRLKNAYAQIFSNLGSVLRDMHRFQEALDVYAAAVKRFGPDATLLDGMRNAASSASNASQLRIAVELSEKLGFLHDEDRYAIRHRLAVLESDSQAALEISEKWLREYPDSTMALLRQADSIGATSDKESALRFCLKALQNHTDSAILYYKTGCVLNSMDRYEDGVLYLRKAYLMTPDNMVMLRNLAYSLAKVAENPWTAECMGEAYHYASQALLNDKDEPTQSFNLANASLKLLRIREGIFFFERMSDLTCRRDFNTTSRLFHENYTWYHTREELFDFHRDWGQLIRREFGPQLSAFSNLPDPNKKLKIGFVSPDFCFHPVSYFFMSVYKKLREHADLEIFLYSNLAVEAEDDMTAEYRELAGSRFRAVKKLSDQDLQQRVLDDGVDVLFDLSGHTTSNRLRAFALRMAPVQVSWLGYPNTTGLDSMDYRISDSITEPEGDSEAFSTERIVRLPGGFHLYYKPKHGIPAKVAPLPARKKGFVMFGTFNNLKKASPVTIELWARVLKSVPGSHLLIKDRNLGSSFNKARILTLMASYGVSPNRIIIKGIQKKNSDHLRAYSHVDIALDCFPYTGTTTTCESLVMGCPIVTLQGDRHASRVSASILTHAGHPEWVAKNEDEFVAIARNLVVDLDKLSDIRMNLREQFNASPVCDPERMDRELSEAIRWMWAQWCEKNTLSASA